MAKKIAKKKATTKKKIVPRGEPTKNEVVEDIIEEPEEAEDVEVVENPVQQLPHSPFEVMGGKMRCEFDLKQRHFAWLEQMARLEAYRRRLTPGVDYHLSDFVEMIIREAMAADPTKAGTLGDSATGRAGEFDSTKGTW